jgi:hypothetical protein
MWVFVSVAAVISAIAPDTSRASRMRAPVGSTLANAV